MIIELFTDGSSYIGKNVKSSASGFAIYINDILVSEGTEFYKKGTNNSAECSAVLRGLERIDDLISKVDKKIRPKIITVHVYADSFITVESCRNWIYGWIKKAKGGVLMNSQGEEVANQEILKSIYNSFLTNDKYCLVFRHINSHVIEDKIYEENESKAISYFQKRHKDEKVKLKVPDKLFSPKKFQKARDSFKAKNKERISNEELLRLLIYNKYVDELAGRTLSKNLAK